MTTWCWFCGGEMVWQGDHTREDYGLDGDGVIANLLCPDCGATALFMEGVE